jgi:hypothetical protein
MTRDVLRAASSALDRLAASARATVRKRRAVWQRVPGSLPCTFEDGRQSIGAAIVIVRQDDDRLGLRHA